MILISKGVHLLSSMHCKKKHMDTHIYKEGSLVVQQEVLAFGLVRVLGMCLELYQSCVCVYVCE